jgi:uncharacterized OB-fold protein
MKPSIWQPTSETRVFWEGCAQGELRYLRCADCGKVQLIPRSLCSACHSEQLDWRMSARAGVVLSHTTVHRAPTAAFRAKTPYVIAIVDMDEGFRLMTNVKPLIRDRIQVGSKVRVGLVECEGTCLPHLEEILWQP